MMDLTYWLIILLINSLVSITFSFNDYMFPNISWLLPSIIVWYPKHSIDQIFWHQYGSNIFRPSTIDFQPFFDSILTDFWLNFDWLLTKFWLDSDWLLTDFWLTSDWLLTDFWLAELKKAELMVLWILVIISWEHF